MKQSKIMKAILVILLAILCISVIGINNIVKTNRDKANKLKDEKESRIIEELSSQQNETNKKIEELNNKIDSNNTLNTDNNTINKNIINEYSDEKLETLNIFMSNFSEVDFEDFSRENFNEEQLIQFAICHLLENDYKNAVHINESNENGGTYTNASDVQASIKKYFGFTLENQSTESFKYKDGKYFHPQADGMICSSFTQVKEIYKNENILTLKGDIYSPEGEYDHLENNDWRYKPMDRKPIINKGLEFRGKMEANVEIVSENGKEKYKLIDYKVGL